jgi:hypothetical protein
MWFFNGCESVTINTALKEEFLRTAGVHKFSKSLHQSPGKYLEVQKVFDLLTLEDGNDTLPRNVGKGLAVDAA